MKKTKNYLSFNPRLKNLARVNRKSMNRPEAGIWYEILHNKKMHYRFLRQKPILNYIVDFYCSKIKLAIEIDGESHNAQIEYDRERTGKLNQLGIKVVRYSNLEIMSNLEGVYFDLKKQIEEREKELGKNPL